MSLEFKKASKKNAWARIALAGPSGSGKSWTSLMLAQVFAEGGQYAAIDTERGSLAKYSDEYTFDVVEPEDSFSPEVYINLINMAAAAGYKALVVDSLSHAWFGKGGALEQVNTAAKRSQSSNSYVAWRDVTPLHNRLVDTMLQVPMHLIATLRTKTEYGMEKDERTGKLAPKKIGLAPIQRDGMEYEFDLFGDMDLDHNLIISKTRGTGLKFLDGQVFNRPGLALARKIKEAYGESPEVVESVERTDEEMDALVRMAELEGGLDASKVLALSNKVFGRSPRTLNDSQMAVLIQQIKENTQHG